MSFALRGVATPVSTGMAIGVASSNIPEAPKPVRMHGHHPPSVVYRLRVASKIGAAARGYFESAKYQDWHLVKKNIKRKFLGPAFRGPDLDDEQEIERDRIEFKENPGEPLEAPVDSARKQASEKAMRLAYLRYRFGGWDGADTSPATLEACDLKWKQVQRQATVRLQSMSSSLPSNDSARKDAEKFLESASSTNSVDLIIGAGDSIRVLEYEAHSVLPGYNYKSLDTKTGSQLSGSNSMLKKAIRGPSKVLKEEYNSCYGPTGWEFGFEMASRAYQTAQATSQIDVALGDAEQDEQDKKIITDREQVNATAAANKAAGKAKKAAECARKGAAAAAGKSARAEIVADAESAVRSQLDAADEAERSAKKARMDALESEQAAEKARKREEEMEQELQRAKEAQEALEAEAAAEGITVQELKNKKRAQLAAETRKLNAAKAAGYDTVEAFEKAKKEEERIKKAEKAMEKELNVFMNYLIKEVEKDEEKRQKEELAAQRALTKSFEDKKAELKHKQLAWDVDDINNYSHRQGLLNRMAELRFMFENLAQWTRECTDAWKKADDRDEKIFQERSEWFNENVAFAAENAGMPVPPVPRTLKAFYDPYTSIRLENGGKIPAGRRLESEPLNVKPHWFDSMSMAVQASAIAWQSAKVGAPPLADEAFVGGRAAIAMYDVIDDAKSKWTPAAIDVGSFEPRFANVNFDWDSRGYSERLKKDGDLRDEEQHGTAPTLDASWYRDESNRLDYTGIEYIQTMPEEYYQLDRVEEDEDDEYDHIPKEDVKKFLNNKVINTTTGAKLKKTNAERLREMIIADNQLDIRSDPKAKLLTEKQISAEILLRAKEEMFATGEYPRDAQEDGYEGGIVTLDEIDPRTGTKRVIKVRAGALLAKRQKLDFAGNFVWDKYGKPVFDEELSYDPFIVDDDYDEEVDFLDAPAMVDAAHPIPKELVKLFPPGIVNEEVFAGEVLYFVKQPTPITKPDGVTLYTYEEWMALKDSIDRGVSYDEALEDARNRRRGVAPADAKERRVKMQTLNDEGRALAYESGAYIKKPKVLAYLRLLTNADPSNPSQTNRDRIVAQMTATGQVTGKSGQAAVNDLVEAQARKEIAGQEGYESAETEDSEADSDGELDFADRAGEAEVKEVDDDVMELMELDNQGVDDVEGMEDFLGPAKPAPGPKPGAVARTRRVINDDDDDDDMPPAASPANNNQAPMAVDTSSAVDDASKRLSRLAMGKNHWSLR